MSSCDRRSLLVSGLALAGLAGCGFTPAYAPGGSGARLQGNVAANAPRSRAGYLLLQRIEERLGRNDAAPLILSTDLALTRVDVGVTSGDETTRTRIFGAATWRLQAASDGAELASGTVENFTAFSTTGSTVATAAAERDAEARLMIILADAVVEALVLEAPALPAT